MSVRRETGSRFVLESFDPMQARVEANERVLNERWTALEYRLSLIETALERLERRLWLGVYGVAAFALTQGVELLIRAAMRGG